MQPKNNFNPRARRQARIFSLQALYQWHMTAQDVSTIEDEFKESERSNATDWPYFQMLFEGVIDHLADVEASFAPLLDRDKTKLDPIELALLRLGTFELLHCQDVPVKVVMNEAIELAKMFGATDSFKYVNGILDKLAKQRR